MYTGFTCPSGRSVSDRLEQGNVIAPVAGVVSEEGPVRAEGKVDVSVVRAWAKANRLGVARNRRLPVKIVDLYLRWLEQESPGRNV